MSRLPHAALMLCVMLLAGCASGTSRATSEEQNAARVGENVIRSLVAALAAGDAEAVASLFADDAVLMGSGAPDETGVGAIRKSYEETFAAYSVQAQGVAVETKLFGEYGFSRGTYTATLIPKAGGEPITGGGRYLVVLQRQADGSWRSFREMSNSDKP